MNASRFFPLMAAWPLTAVFLQEDVNRTPIWVILLILLIVVLIFWWGLTRNRAAEPPADTDHTPDHAPDTHAHAEETAATGAVTVAEAPADEPVAVPAEAVAAPPPEPDDLKRIEGIGPKIQSILNDAGILTFDQLARTEVSTLRQIVQEDAGLRIADPTTWPEQAELAAAGQWDALEALQEELNAGRRAD